METQKEEKILKDAVLVFFATEDSTLLGTKMGGIGKGSLNAHGGGIEEGETPRFAGAREVEEETRGDRKVGVIVKEKDLVKKAIMHFRNITTSGITFVCTVHIYFTYHWEGEIITTEDIRHPAWYKNEHIPFYKMMLADRVWFPKVLEGKKIIGKASYGPEQKTLIGEVEIEYVDSFPEE